ncbi:MAG: MaoC/PaaZ C-terminal domain-containing protein [Actinomycetota bacterium]
MGLNRDLAGKKYPTKTFEVTADRIEAYARATNDDNERYFGGDDSVASPVFPIVSAFESFMEAAMDQELQADLLRLVHGSEEHLLHRPLRPGDSLTVTPVLESIESKETGETFTVAAVQTNPSGDLVAETRGTMFIRGSGSRRAAAAEARATKDAGEARTIVYEETTKVDEDQSQRYAVASGDHNPIHLDENTAKMAGLPGIILHGMCTMAIATKAAVNGLAGGDPTKVKRVAVRFSRPVLLGQELTTKLWATGDDTYGFETYNSKGAAVIKDGVVELRP